MQVSGQEIHKVVEKADIKISNQLFAFLSNTPAQSQTCSDHLEEHAVIS